MAEEAPSRRIPPHSSEAEKSVLGSMMLSAECVDQALAVLTPDDFYYPMHQAVFSTMSSLATAGAPVDLVSVTARMDQDGKLNDGSAEYLAGLSDDILSVANIEYHLGIVREKAALRRLIDVCMTVANDCYAAQRSAEDLLAEAGDEIYKISARSSRGEVIPIRQALQASYAQMAAAMNTKGGLLGIRTGFPMMDQMLSGFQKSQLIVIAGRPGMGKTSFALNIVQHASMSQNVLCLLFSLEMGAEQLATRMLCSEAHVDMQKTRTGRMGADEYTKIAVAMKGLSGAPIYVDDSANITVTEMTAKARRLQRKRGLGMIVIDYLQLMRGSGRVENRNQEVAQITRSLKIMAKELNVPIVLLSQLSRAGEKEGSKYPKLSELRESGAIEQDADVVIFLQRDDYYVEMQTPENIGKAKIIIAKQRNGPTGAINVQWNGELTRYMEVENFHTEDHEPAGAAEY